MNSSAIQSYDVHLQLDFLLTDVFIETINDSFNLNSIIENWSSNEQQ